MAEDNLPGGLKGYSSGNCSLPIKMPPSYGESLGPSRTKYHLRIFEGSGRAVICGEGSLEMFLISFRKRCCTKKRRTHNNQRQVSHRGDDSHKGKGRGKYAPCMFSRPWVCGGCAADGERSSERVMDGVRRTERRGKEAGGVRWRGGRVNIIVPFGTCTRATVDWRKIGRVKKFEAEVRGGPALRGYRACCDFMRRSLACSTGAILAKQGQRGAM